MLYTGKGDNGKTGLFGCDQKFSKSSTITEALGSLDEVNCYVGICKVYAADSLFDISGATLVSIMEDVQNNLFIVQAHVAGADKKIDPDAVLKLEHLINTVEKQLPPIKTFLIPGSSKISAHFDFARTLARRAERRVVAVSEEYPKKIDAEILAYLNRLSSLLYACARLTAGTKEHAPTY